MTDASNAPILAPNGGKMAFRARFRLETDDLQFLQDSGNNGNPNVSWNVMQRGLADDPGGQWKMSIVSETNSNRVRVECITSQFAGQSDNIRATSRLDVSTPVSYTHLTLPTTPYV